MKKLNLTFAAVFICFVANAFPCKKYVVDFGGGVRPEQKVMPGRIKISWSINFGVNNCGFAKEEIAAHRFVIKLENLFEELVLTDTIDQNYFILNTYATDNTSMIFTVEELGSTKDSNSVLINPEQAQIPELRSKLDTLNFYLLNGCFWNALAVLDAFKNDGLTDAIKKEYTILFPDHYPYEQTYFNCYIDSTTMTLVKMPVVHGLTEFIKVVNKEARELPRGDKGLKFFAKVAGDGKVREFQIIPESCRNIIESGLPLLKFSPELKQMNEVVVILKRSKNGRKFHIVNKRALMDQNSPQFRTSYFSGSAVH